MSEKELGRERRFPPLLTAETADRILGGHGRVSLDLGLSLVEVQLDEDNATLPDGNVVSFRDLERIRERGKAVFFPGEDGLYQVAISRDRFYKLVPTAGAPTLEIDGIRMHRTKGTTPDVDAGLKIGALGIDGGFVLDTCTGLGYTVLAALGGGADAVITVERRPEVIRIAEMNPWSWLLFSDGRVHPLIGDAYHIVDVFPDGFFDYIIHDPPRFSRAGHLYGADFYARLHRVLRIGGRLFHYTGEPGSRYRRVDLRRGVMRRLGQAGFSRLRYDGDTRGVVCEKRGG